MNDLISRKDAIEAIMYGNSIDIVDRTKLEQRIKELPAIEAEPVVHAEWEYHWFDSICSNCGYRNKADSVTRMRDYHKFCPACGARMDGKKVE